MYADLHMHSLFSDGTDTPANLFALAKKNDVSVISITDHDSIKAYENLPDDSLRYGIRIITGIVIFVLKIKKMLHILSYNFNLTDKRLMSLIARMSEETTRSTRLNFMRLVSLGIISYDWERVLAINSEQPRVSGVHVVKAMKADNYVINGLSLWDVFALRGLEKV